MILSFSIIICFLYPTFLCSSLFLFVFLFQFYNPGLCQLHSISAFLGIMFCLHSHLFCLWCVVCSHVFVNLYFSFGNLIRLLWNVSEYSTIKCNFISPFIYKKSLSFFILHSISSLPDMYCVQLFFKCSTVSVCPMHLLHNSLSFSRSRCLVLNVLEGHILFLVWRCK